MNKIESKDMFPAALTTGDKLMAIGKAKKYEIHSAHLPSKDVSRKEYFVPSSIEEECKTLSKEIKDLLKSKVNDLLSRYNGEEKNLILVKAKLAPIFPEGLAEPEITFDVYSIVKGLFQEEAVKAWYKREGVSPAVKVKSTSTTVDIEDLDLI